uniref:Ammonium_transp domain-containing protein n=1 Tax=Elaeophora elaphi TaxID=1147741 RepID=A0A0R3RMW0_9BILA
LVICGETKLLSIIIKIIFQIIQAVTSGRYGLIYSGSFKLLAIQMLCTVTVLVYSAIFGLIALIILGKSPLGIRVTDYEEQIGADVVEHGLAGTNIARYHLEKPLSSKTFATVTKAITKWKIQTRTNRALREQEDALGYRRKPNNGAALIRQRKNKLSNGAFFSPSYHIRARNSPSHGKIPSTLAASLSPNIPKEGNLLVQQFSRSITPFRRKESNMKYAKIDEMALTSKRPVDDENGKNPNCSRTSQSNLAPVTNRLTNSIGSTLKSLNPDQLRLDHGSGPVQIGRRRSLDHNIIPEKGVLQCVTSNIDSGNASRIVTSAASCRNKILPLISDAV